MQRELALAFSWLQWLRERALSVPLCGYHLPRSLLQKFRPIKPPIQGVAGLFLCGETDHNVNLYLHNQPVIISQMGQLSFI